MGEAPRSNPGQSWRRKSGGDASTPSQLVFAHAGTDFTFAPALNGALAIEVAGGTTIWTGDNAFPGSLTVAAGTLLINGGHTPSTAPVNAVAEDAVLGGNGSLNGNTAVHGIISPGQNGIGTLEIAGLLGWLRIRRSGNRTNSSA